MKPAKVEQLTLAYFMIRKRAEADTRKQMEAWAKASLDQRAAEEELLATKEFEAEWAREAQGASDSDDDVVLVEPKRAARGGGGGGGGCVLVTCETAQRAPTSPSPSSLFTCTAVGGRRRGKSDSLV